MISVKCPFCGATININKATNVQKCSACGNEFLLEHNDELNEQTLIDNGNIFLDFKEYQKAINCFEKACELAPENYAVWVGLSKAESENFENNVEWMFSYLENVNSKKASCSAKHAVKWVKVGSKPPVILPFGK